MSEIINCEYLGRKYGVDESTCDISVEKVEDVVLPNGEDAKRRIDLDTGEFRICRAGPEEIKHSVFGTIGVTPPA